MKIEELYLIFKECGNISTDTRKLLPGSLFFALKGENFNGNLFAHEALEKGCAYVVADDPSINRHPRIIQVPDVLAALQNLAKHHRQQLNIPFIGITGSNGKTTTKELVASVLSRKYKVYATTGNLNNHIGVPLTLLSVKDHEIAIIEMGANHTGEIAALCKIANPDFGIITNIGRAHLGGFGSPEGVIQAKSELYDHLRTRKGKVFADAGNPLLMRLCKEKKLEPILYGNATGSACIGKITDSSKFLNAELSISGRPDKISIFTSLVGDYNLSNILAAACIGNYFSVSNNDIATAINSYKPSNSRSQMLVTSRNKIVLDAYNANPNSMESSISNFLSLKEDLPKMIILGDMLELGSYAQQEHKAIVTLLINAQLKNIFLVGPEFCKCGLPKEILCFRSVDEIIEHFRSNPVTQHSILLKGSRGVKLEKLLDVL